MKKALVKTPVSEMETNHILKSTLTGESRQEKGDTKTNCFLVLATI